MEIQIPDSLHRCQPILIFGPAARTGTTLVMRLLNSTGEMLIYGENAHVMDFADTCARVSGTFTRLAETSAREVARIKSGDVDFWPSFNPSADQAVPGYAAMFYELMMIYLRDSLAHGFARWGVKNVLREFSVIRTIQQLLPDAKVIVICRNLAEVIRSQKARRFIAAPEQVEAQCQVWRRNTEQALDYSNGNFLVMHHEALVRDPGPEIARLEGFARVSGIDRRVLERRVNTFRGQASDGLSDSEYIAPGELSAAEVAVIGRYEGLGALASAAS